MSYVIERPVKNDLEPVWAGTAKGASHAILVPASVAYAYKRKMAEAANKTVSVSEAKRTEAYAMLPAANGKIVTACKRTLDVGRLGTSLKPCKVCAAQFTAEPKKGRALSERQIEPVATGLVDGDPRAAESRREAEIKVISGDAIKVNAEIADTARQGRREAALDMAHDLDRRGPAAPVPTGSAQAAKKGVSTAGARRTAGQRGEARTDGVALVQGANMAPVQPRSGWIAKAGTLAMPLGRERADRGALGQPLTRHVTKGDNAVQACVEMRCAHIVGGIPADHKEAITYREYAKLSRTRQRRTRERIARVQQENKRAAAWSARQPVKIHPGNKSKGDSPKIEALMGAPGRRDGLDWSERKATTVR